MVMKAGRPTDEIGIAAMIDPDAYGAGTYNSGWVSLSVFNTVMAIITAGDMGGGGLIDASIQQATDGAGTGAKAVAGKAITQMTQAGGSSNTQAIIEVDGEDLDVDANFTHVRISLVVAGAACDAAAVLIGIDPRYGPASDVDAATVAEIVGLDA